MMYLQALCEALFYQVRSEASFGLIEFFSRFGITLNISTSFAKQFDKFKSTDIEIQFFFTIRWELLIIFIKKIHQGDLFLFMGIIKILFQVIDSRTI